MSISRKSPDLAALKHQARRLRSALQAQGTAISHGKALELIAYQHGFASWNHAAADMKDRDRSRKFCPGDRVSGQYLGIRFGGEIISIVTASSRPETKITIRFDRPVDVVTSPRFSNLRQQVSNWIMSDGRSPQRLSNGQPHLIVDP